MIVPCDCPCRWARIGEGLPVTSGMTSYEDVADFNAKRDPSEVATFKPSAEALQRVGVLLQRENAEGLTVEERREMDHYENLELLMNLAKARARQLLAHGSDPNYLLLLAETQATGLPMLHSSTNSFQSETPCGLREDARAALDLAIGRPPRRSRTARSSTMPSKLPAPCSRVWASRQCC